VIVADVLEGAPAEHAGIHVQDIITSVDGKPTTSVPLFSIQLNIHRDPSRSYSEHFVAPSSHPST
jgi:C-terminal processing protease CtpA/Prc